MIQCCCLGPTYECRGDAADGVTQRLDDLQRLVLGQLQQEHVAPPSADPQCYSALHEKGFDVSPGRAALDGQRRPLAALPGPATALMPAGGGPKPTSDSAGPVLPRGSAIKAGLRDVYLTIWTQSMQSTNFSLLLSQTSTVDVLFLLR